MLAIPPRFLRRLIAPALCSSLLAPLHPHTAAADWGDGVELASYHNGFFGIQLLRPTSTDVVIVWARGTGNFNAQALTDPGVFLDGWSGVLLNAWYSNNPLPATTDGTGGIFDAHVVTDAFGNRDVYLENVSGDGSHAPPTGWGWPVATTGALEHSPAIAGDGAGGAYVAWMAGSSSVYLKRFLADGSLAPGWPAAGLIVSSGSTLTGRPAIDGDGAGGAYVVWLSFDDARALRVNSNGTIAGGWPSGGLGLGPNQNGQIARILPSGEGRIAVWIQPFSPSTITLQRFLSNGTLDPAWPAGGLVAVNVSASISLYRFVSDGQGGVTLVWEQSGLPRALHILANGTIAPGYAAGGNSPLDAAAQYVPGSFAAATGPGEGLIFAWNDTRPSRPGVRVRWISSGGGPVDPDSGRVTSHGGTVISVGDAIEDNSGSAYVAWYERDPNFTYHLVINRVVYGALVGVGPSPVAVPGLALRAPAPNPAHDELSARVALPTDAPARLELLDVAGRRLRAVDFAGAGELTVRLDGLNRVAPGVYLLRLTQDRASRLARVAIMR